MSEVSLKRDANERTGIARYAPKPGEVRNPHGINGLVQLARHLKSLGLVEQCGSVLQQCLVAEDESVRLAACALALKYMFGVPQGEIVDGKNKKGFDWASLTDEQRKFLVAVRDALDGKTTGGDRATPGIGGSVHAGGAGGAAAQGEPR